jgi:hypothetical protein
MDIPPDTLTNVPTYSTYAYDIHVMLRTYGTKNWSDTLYFLNLTSHRPHIRGIQLEPLCEISFSTYQWASYNQYLVNVLHGIFFGIGEGKHKVDGNYPFLLSLLEIAFNEPEYKHRVTAR